MKVISIISQKGGVSKTTLAINLAVCATLNNKEALIIDLDPQVSATMWKDLRELESPVVVSAQAMRVEKTLETARKAGADLVFIDTAPHSDSISAISARVADFILIPTKCGILDLKAIPSTIETAKASRKPSAIVLCAVPTRGAVVEEVTDILMPLGIEICPVAIYDRAAYRNALTGGLSAQELEPKGKASEEIQALYKWLVEKVG